MCNTPNWLLNVYSLLEKEDIDGAMEHIFDEIDDMFDDGRFDECNELLKVIDVDRLDTNTLVAFMAVTHCASDKLDNRPDFIDKVENRLRVIAPDRVDRLMVGRKP